MTDDPRRATLFLNDRAVGAVTYGGASDSWSFGSFEPFDAFSEFAPIFGAWSLLMHADEDGEHLSPAASEELRRAECAIDALRARLEWQSGERVTACNQINIDGTLVEWKQR